MDGRLVQTTCYLLRRNACLHLPTDSCRDEGENRAAILLGLPRFASRMGDARLPNERFRVSWGTAISSP